MSALRLLLRKPSFYTRHWLQERHPVYICGKMPHWNVECQGQGQHLVTRAGRCHMQAAHVKSAVHFETVVSGYGEIEVARTHAQLLTHTHARTRTTNHGGWWLVEDKCNSQPFFRGISWNMCNKPVSLSTPPPVRPSVAPTDSSAACLAAPRAAHVQRALAWVP